MMLIGLFGTKLRWMETKRSACFACAIATRSPSGSVMSVSRVRSTSAEVCDSSRRLRRCAMSRAMSFSRVPPRPMAPVSSPPCPGSRRMVFTPRSNALLSGRPRPPLKSAGSRPGRLRRRGRGRCRATNRAWICCTGKITGDSEEPVNRIPSARVAVKSANLAARGRRLRTYARGVVRPSRLRLSSIEPAEYLLLHPLFAVARKPGDHRVLRPCRTVMRKHPSL